ncbi:MAG: hypothetical protein A2Y03_02550 [Omnitrophica WOR_2 bacterium GWF2_38_59]|nr:MAG: hypothetical protein A2Y06_06840 [Omnitrophica WOR_2 bacterium GWA2_37_7]OGX22863.1 MAG: hypothetical protein A2Y03_02550 [Omnitrophica WOR_2 bacterium GWF2_38_59]OGX48548.1 MAG: hypothetical protein A2243_03185 [Omnitrophica WOR_2 bacterium RIFOXYA2_FULL_38_17]OGX54239.1 MAG: hypothetical protein A2267_04660 [Omnitrophica WOR_2 bacterium RIFOXYA12_FULL_38_10]OGX58963.1 MAG: hypothetical protein A2447_07375 [Omnitrophica WOR_2 bacterium RIFOXYC2_FULL_38_12]OGX59320.1 MAG: hypothetical 
MLVTREEQGMILSYCPGKCKKKQYSFKKDIDVILCHECLELEDVKVICEGDDFIPGGVL